uniref:Uncharacterized protein n=1 Tax=viral metagenome TaxID=1070528 RepID=A0A6C0EKN2_9ZZZZ
MDIKSSGHTKSTPLKNNSTSIGGVGKLNLKIGIGNNDSSIQTISQYNHTSCINMYKDCIGGVNDTGCKIFIDNYEKCLRYNNPEPCLSRPF